MKFDAFYPASLAHRTELVTRDLGDGITLCYPRLDPNQVIRICAQLRAAGAALRRRSVHEIVTAIDAAAAQLRDPANELGAAAREVIPRTTRYSPAMVELVLQRMCADWTETSLTRLLRAELGDPRCLDEYVGDACGRRVRAFGPELTAHVFSGNVPGVAVTSVIRALLLKSPSFGKTAQDEPLLPVLFARALERVDAQVAGAFVCTYWPGGQEDIETTLIEHADAVVVYGGHAVVESARRKSSGAQRLIVHGPKFSIGVVQHAALNDEIASDIALAVATFDQQGCVSPHAVFLMAASFEQARAFAQRIAQRLESLEQQLPRGPLSTEEAVALQAARAQAEFSEIAGRNSSLISGNSYTIVVDDQPEFEASCLNRFLRLKAVENVNALVQLLAPFSRDLQSVALAGLPHADAHELTTALGATGVTRFTSFAALPWPPAHWHHDGSSPLRELIRWVDWE